VENTERIDVGEIPDDINRNMRALDAAAVWPIGGITLGLALKSYLAPEALTGEGKIVIDGEKIEVLLERLEERIVRDRAGFDEWIKENPGALEEVWEGV
jgi:hypothetical protein